MGEPAPWACRSRARRAAAAVALACLAGSWTPLAAARSEADDLYTRAMALFEQRTGDALETSFGLFEQAVAETPQNARAHAGLASSGCLLALYSLAPPSEVLPRAEAAARQAVHLDPELAAAWAALGLVDYLYHWDWARAERRFREALERDPSYATAHHWYGMSLMARSRFDEAIDHLDAAARLAPDSPIVQVKRGTVLSAAGRFDEAEEQLRAAAAKFPSFPLAQRELGFLYLEQGRSEAAVAAFERAAELAGGASKSTGGLAFAYTAIGRKDLARDILEGFLERSRRELVPPMYLALMYVGLGERAAAFHWLEKAYEGRDPGLVYLDVKPGFEALRDDQRFSALLRRIGLRREEHPAAAGSHPPSPES